MAQINNILTEIKQHILGCFAFLDCGFENVRQLLNAVKGNDPQGFREYEHVLFDDRLGNYFWIEKTSDVSITRKNNGILGTCKGAYHEARQRFSLFCMVNNAKEEQLFECLAGCLANYSCTVTISGGDYDSVAVVSKELGNIDGLNDILSNLDNYAIVRLDFSLVYDLLPTNYGIEDCDCEPCNDCNDNLPPEVIQPICDLQITGLSYIVSKAPILTIQYLYNGIGNVFVTHDDGTPVDYQCQSTITGTYSLTGTVLNTDGATVILSGGVSDCDTICAIANFVTSAELHQADTGATTIYTPSNIEPCTGTKIFSSLAANGCSVSLNTTTGQVTFPPQTIPTYGEYYYYLTCNGEVIQTFKITVTN